MDLSIDRRLPHWWAALMKRVDEGWIGEIDSLWLDGMAWCERHGKIERPSSPVE